jgi:hypothetical protein
MHTRSNHPHPVHPALRHPTAAIVWIDRRHAVIARTMPDGPSELSEVAADPVESAMGTYVARVAHELGDRDQVVVLGPNSMRLELEREYVGIYHHPERLVDVEPEAPASPEELEARLREITGG